MPNSIVLSSFTVTQDAGAVSIDDLHPLTLSWTIPPVRYSCMGAIKELQNGEFRIGFVQYISGYKFVQEYSQSRVIIDVPTPISDSGGTAGKDQTQEVRKDFEKGDGSGNDYDMDAIYPWYEPPLIIRGPYKAARLQRKYFHLRGGDAPNGTSLWVWPWDATRKSIGSEDDYLKRIERRHDFVTCIVLWHQATGQVQEVLGKAEWTHKLVIEAAALASGTRIKASLDDPDPRVTTTVPADFTIPAGCLAAPCANGIVKGCLRVERKTAAGVATTRTQSIHVKAGDSRRFKWDVKEVPKVRLSQTGHL